MADTRKREVCARCGKKGVNTTPPFYAYWKEGVDDKRVQRTKRCRICGHLSWHDAVDLTKEQKRAVIDGTYKGD